MPTGKASFGVSLKARAPDGGSWQMGIETTVLDHACTAPPCKMHHFWCGGGLLWQEELFLSSRVRYYVDGERSASVDLPFGLAHAARQQLPLPPPGSPPIRRTRPLRPRPRSVCLATPHSLYTTPAFGLNQPPASRHSS